MAAIKLTQDQLSLINKYVNDPIVRDRLIDYITGHDIIEKEVFQIIGNSKEASDNSFIYNPVNYDVFIRRLPIYQYSPYLYSPGSDIETKFENIGTFSQYAMGLYNEIRDDESHADKLEKLYTTVDRMYYHHRLDLRTIFNYPIRQTGYVSKTTFLTHWAHYLDLSEEQGLNDITPKCFIVEYNRMLERAKLNPIIYEIEEQYIGEFIYREGNVFRVEGIIPCDENGNPILRWIGINVVNPAKIWAKVKKESKGYLYIEANPKTEIWGLNCWGTNDDGSDCWYRLYAGPLLMEFDYEKLKPLRLRAKLTQKQVAEAIGSVERTYQKWESGTTTPDCNYLLRLMNVLDIKTVDELIKIT